MSVDKQLSIKVYNKTAVEYFANRGVQIKTGANFLDGIMRADMQEIWRDYCGKALMGEYVSDLLGEKSPEYVDLYYMLVLQPILDFEGKPDGFTVFVKDVTQLHPVRWEKKKVITDL